MLFRYEAMLAYIMNGDAAKRKDWSDAQVICYTDGKIVSYDSPKTEIKLTDEDRAAKDWLVYRSAG